MVSNSSQDNVVVTTKEKYVLYPCSITQLDQNNTRNEHLNTVQSVSKNLANQSKKFENL